MCPIICLRCGYDAKYYSRLKEHLARKNICEPLRDCVTIDYVYEYYKKRQKKKNVDVICEYCDKKFETRDNRFRVHRHRCRKRAEAKITDGSYHSEFLGALGVGTPPSPFSEPDTEELERLRVENRLLLRKLQALKSEEIPDLTSGGETRHALGSEDMAHLRTDAFRNRLNAVLRNGQSCWDAIPLFVQCLHFGNERNDNVRVRDANDSFSHFWDGKRWVINPRSEIYETVIQQNWIKMQELLRDETFDNKYYKKMEEFLHSSKKFMEYLVRQITCIFVNEGKYNIFRSIDCTYTKMNSINEFLLAD